MRNLQELFLSYREQMTKVDTAKKSMFKAEKAMQRKLSKKEHQGKDTSVSKRVTKAKLEYDTVSEWIDSI